MDRLSRAAPPRRSRDERPRSATSRPRADRQATPRFRPAIGGYVAVTHERRQHGQETRQGSVQADAVARRAEEPRSRGCRGGSQQPQGRAQGSAQGGRRPLRCRGRNSRSDAPRSAEAKRSRKEGRPDEEAERREPQQGRQKGSPHPRQCLISRRLRPEFHPQGGLPGPGHGLEREPTFGPPHHRTRRGPSRTAFATAGLKRRQDRGSSAQAVGSRSRTEGQGDLTRQVGSCGLARKGIE